jgi:hypothetical protein
MAGGTGSEMPAVTSGTGITLTFAGSVAGFRVELIDATALSYCYTIPTTAAGSVAIPWTSFKTNCSDASKTMVTYAAGMPIVKIQVTVASTPSMAFPFNFCLISVAGM